MRVADNEKREGEEDEQAARREGPAGILGSAPAGWGARASSSS